MGKTIHRCRWVSFVPELLSALGLLLVNIPSWSYDNGLTSQACHVLETAQHNVTKSLSLSRAPEDCSEQLTCSTTSLGIGNGSLQTGSNEKQQPPQQQASFSLGTTLGYVAYVTIWE